MAKKKTLLELSPMTTEADFGPSNNQLALSDGNMLAGDRRLIGNESQKQKTAIDAITKKTLYGMDRIAQIDLHAGTVFEETAHAITATKQAAQGQLHEPYVDEFSHRLLQMSARHMFAVVEIGASGVAQEVHRSPYPPVSEPQGFLKRFFG